MRLIGTAASAQVATVARRTLAGGALDLWGYTETVTDLGPREVGQLRLAGVPFRARPLNASEVPAGTTVDSRRLYRVALPSGVEVGVRDWFQSPDGEERWDVVGLLDAPGGGPVVRYAVVARAGGGEG